MFDQGEQSNWFHIQQDTVQHQTHQESRGCFTQWHTGAILDLDIPALQLHHHATCQGPVRGHQSGFLALVSQCLSQSQGANARFFLLIGTLCQGHIQQSDLTICLRKLIQRLLPEIRAFRWAQGFADQLFSQ